MTLPYHGSQGGSKIQEAHLIFQDLSEKYPPTCTILNGKALCSMHMGNFEDAEGLLLESLNKVSPGDLTRLCPNGRFLGPTLNAIAAHVDAVLL